MSAVLLLDPRRIRMASDRACFYTSYIARMFVDFACKLRTFIGSEDILVGPHNFKGLLEGSRLGLRVMVRIGLMLTLGVRSLYDVYQSAHKDRTTGKCICV